MRKILKNSCPNALLYFSFSFSLSLFHTFLSSPLLPHHHPPVSGWVPRARTRCFPLSSFPPVYTLQSKPERVCWLVAGLRCLRSIGSRATRRMERTSSSSSSSSSSWARVRSLQRRATFRKKNVVVGVSKRNVGWPALRFPGVCFREEKGTGRFEEERRIVSSRSTRAHTYTHTHTHRGHG